jgi:predicted transcriptional regulator
MERPVARKPALPQPTNAELAILRVLWRDGPSTVREVHDQLEERGVGYTTVLKLLQIMTDKGLVRRDESARSHIYRAESLEKDVKRRLVSDLLDRAFEGSAASLVMHALETQPASADDLAQIRSLLNALDDRGTR